MAPAQRLIVNSHVWLKPVLVLAMLAAALAVLAKPAVSQESGFGDVSGGVHAPAIDALADAGVIEGTECAENMLCPDEPFLR